MGRQASCQVAAGAHAVTDADSLPLQWRLFLPLGAKQCLQLSFGLV
nr:hypothetical protein [Streptomyces canus]